MQQIFEAPQIRISVFDSRDAIVTDSIVTQDTPAVDAVMTKLMENHKELVREQIIVFKE